MKIINSRNNITIATNISLAKTFSERMRGLIGTKSLALEHALIISQCNSVHTCFMKYPIDVLFCDKNNVVVKMSEHLGKWKFTVPCYHAAYVIELPEQSIKKYDIRVGDGMLIN
jgi:uncharacterized membrane protein (UPF0127 family)